MQPFHMILLGSILLYAAAGVALDRYGRRAVVGRYDAIVVAGCRVLPDGRPSQALARRTTRAVELWKEGIAPQIVFTGGAGSDYPASEASVAAALAHQFGVPKEATLLEERSTNTDENARFAAQLLPRSARIVVVSDAYHVFRCERVFRRYFSAAQGTGSTGHPWARVRGSMREVAAVAAYGVLGRLG